MKSAVHGDECEHCLSPECILISPMKFLFIWTPKFKLIFYIDRLSQNCTWSTFCWPQSTSLVDFLFISYHPTGVLSKCVYNRYLQVTYIRRILINHLRILCYCSRHISESDLACLTLVSVLSKHWVVNRLIQIFDSIQNRYIVHFGRRCFLRVSVERTSASP